MISSRAPAFDADASTRASDASTVSTAFRIAGNCEMMIDPATGGPHTAHTTNPVPFLVVDEHGKHGLREGGALCDVGPTILKLLGLEQPVEMTGRDLRLS